MVGIFVSYRRSLSIEGVVGRLSDALAARYGADSVFMDVESVASGEDWLEAIENALSSSEVLLAVIHPGWVEDRRLTDERDVVRMELERGFDLGLQVLPVLVHGASMPAQGRMPDGLKDVERRQAHELRHSSWRSDIESLFEAIRVRVYPTPPIETFGRSGTVSIGAHDLSAPEHGRPTGTSGFGGRVGFRGDRGSASSIACTTVYPQAEVVGFRPLSEAFGALAAESIASLVAPISTPNEGLKLDLIEALAESHRALIGDVFSLREEVALMAPHEANLADMGRAYGEPWALDRAEHSLFSRGIEPISVVDVRSMSSTEWQPQDNSWAILGPPQLSTTYGWKTIVADFADDPNAETTYAVVKWSRRPVTSNSATRSFMVVETEGLAGSLALALIDFGIRGAAVRQIHSMPSTSVDGDLYFLEVGHVPERGIPQRLIDPLPNKVTDIRHLGTC